MSKISQTEFDRRVNKYESEGIVWLSDARIGDVIEVFTEPAVYRLTVIDPASLCVEITSLHDPDFFEGRFCLFCGSVWDDVEIENWNKKAPMRVSGCFLKDCHPVIDLEGRLRVLPKMYEVMMGGMPFFKTTGTPELLDGCIEL